MFGDGNIRCPYINSPGNATALREKQVPHMQDPMAKKNTHTRIPTAERATTMYNFWKTLNIMLSVALTFYINAYIPSSVFAQISKKNKLNICHVCRQGSNREYKDCRFFSCFFLCDIKWFFLRKKLVYIYSKYVFFHFSLPNLENLKPKFHPADPNRLDLAKIQKPQKPKL